MYPFHEKMGTPYLASPLHCTSGPSLPDYFLVDSNTLYVCTVLTVNTSVLRAAMRHISNHCCIRLQFAEKKQILSFVIFGLLLTYRIRNAMRWTVACCRAVRVWIASVSAL